ncbi:MAG: hypothetical protein ACX93N_07815 [Pseudohaliea sp.]
MDASVILVILIGAAVVGLAVFVMAASAQQFLRGRVSRLPLPRFTRTNPRGLRRTGFDRRQKPQKISFPVTINGRLIREDRRRGERRRQQR